MKGVTTLLWIALAIFFLYLLLWPVPIDPVAWTPPEAPSLTGIYEPNTALAAVERIGTGVDYGPEDTAFDSRGWIYAGMEHGRIVRFAPDGGGYEPFAETGGRPLGMDFGPDGRLIVADAVHGLLSFSRDGKMSVLATEAGGLGFGLTNDVDVAPNGMIFFSDATSKFSIDTYILDALEHGSTGRLLVYDPKQGDARVLLDGLSFANGVAVSPDQSFVLVCETWKYRIQRYWLSGPRQGESEIFIDNLPGFPDGVSSNGRNTFWVALFAPRDGRLDALLPHPILRSVLFRVRLLPSAVPPYGFVLGLDHTGRVTQNLQDPTGASYPSVTSAEEYRGMLYLGSIAQDSLGRLPVS